MHCDRRVRARGAGPVVGLASRWSAFQFFELIRERDSNPLPATSAVAALPNELSLVGRVGRNRTCVHRASALSSTAELPPGRNDSCVPAVCATAQPRAPGGVGIRAAAATSSSLPIARSRERAIRSGGYTAKSFASPQLPSCRGIQARRACACNSVPCLGPMYGRTRMPRGATMRLNPQDLFANAKAKRPRGQASRGRSRCSGRSGL